MSISIFVDVEFGFERNFFDLGKIRKHRSVSKSAVFLIKDTSKINMLEVSSDSPHLMVGIASSSADSLGRIEVNITVSADTPPGKMNATVTASVTDGSHPAATMQVRGTVIGNYDVSPEIVRFSVVKSQPLANQAAQEIRVINAQDGAGLQLLGAKDSDNRLTFDIDTLEAGRQFLIRARPNENALSLSRNVSGEIIILTNDADQPEIRILYSMIFPK